MIEQTRRTFGLPGGIAAALLFCVSAAAVPLTGSLGTHDPSRIHKEGNRYYVFATGGSTAPIRSEYSDDFTNWQTGPAVFSGLPAWAVAEVSPNAGFMWAPDIYYFNNEYRLYYSLSRFGSQNSVIGMATNTTLDFNDPSYAWVDQQTVIESEVGAPYNAIDPGIFYDESNNRMWMTFGSFWNGIYITELDPATGKRITPSSATTNIARNPGSSANAIEAPYLTEHDGYYYLFVNWDTCCRGVNSTYKIRVGRGTSPTGPFVDRDGNAMTAGGGDLFLATEGPIIGPGHFSEFAEGGVDYFSYHYYDGNASGASKLAIDEFAWTFDGWPTLVSDLPPGDYNRNGIVEAADYTVWRNALGSANHVADGDGNGTVNEGDFAVWKAHFGESIASGATGQESVPEPPSFSMLTLGILAMLFRKSREQHGQGALFQVGLRWRMSGLND